MNARSARRSMSSRRSSNNRVRMVKCVVFFLIMCIKDASTAFPLFPAVSLSEYEMKLLDNQHAT